MKTAKNDSRTKMADENNVIVGDNYEVIETYKQEHFDEVDLTTITEDECRAIGNLVEKYKRTNKYRFIKENN